jgi:hypothetical protein
MTGHYKNCRVSDKCASGTRTNVLSTSVKGRRVKENIYFYSCAGGDSHPLTGCGKSRLVFYAVFFKLKLLVTFGISTNLLARRYVMAATSLPTTKKKKGHLEKNVVCKINSIIFRAVICMNIFQKSVGKDGVCFLH